LFVRVRVVRGKNLLFFSLFTLLFSFPIFAERAMSLDEVVSALGGAGKVELRWDPFFASGTFVAGEREVAFASGSAGESGMVLIDHREVLTLPLPYLERGVLRFPEPFIDQLGRSLGLVTSEIDNSDRFRIAAIIIDPGHGGRDPGTSATHTVNGRTLNSVEKDITLKVSRMLYAALVAAFPDKNILITREGDTTLTLDQRVDMANSVNLKKNEAAIFVSVHANSAWPDKDPRGFEVWYLSPSFRREVLDRTNYDNPEEVFPILNSMLEEELTTESILLANSILKRLEEAIGNLSPSRGLKAEEWFVVRNARMPSVLVEMGFVSNEAEALLMDSEAHLKKLSDALYKGIVDFVTFFEHSGGLISFNE
jgi:N-acetylmuramoyl-L-alanine amidase